MRPPLGYPGVKRGEVGEGGLGSLKSGIIGSTTGSSSSTTTTTPPWSRVPCIEVRKVQARTIRSRIGEQTGAFLLCRRREVRNRLPPSLATSTWVDLRLLSIQTNFSGSKQLRSRYSDTNLGFLFIRLLAARCALNL